MQSHPTHGAFRGAREQREQVEQEPQREFLTFRLGTESFGIDILKVQEIRGWDEPTAIPNSPAFIKGVINLRGVIVPVLDLRMKFNLPQADYDRFTVVIILNVASRVIGVVVDAVSDVLSLDKDEIRKAPEFASAARRGSSETVVIARRQRPPGPCPRRSSASRCRAARASARRWWPGR